jgi:hypothetical protein
MRKINPANMTVGIIHHCRDVTRPKESKTEYKKTNRVEKYVKEGGMGVF